MTTLTIAPKPPAADSRPANELAMSITGRPYISWSQINLMRSCPRKFAMKYIERLRPDFTPTSLKFGSAFHSAMEYFFRGQMECYTADAAELHEVFRRSWRDWQADDPPIRFNKNEYESTLDELAGRMIAAFIDSPIASQRQTVLAVEERITASIADDLPDVLACVDLIRRQADGGFQIIDFKTSRSRWNSQKAAEAADQLELYRNVTGRLSGGDDVSLAFVVVTKGKHPSVEFIEVPSNQDRSGVIVESIRNVWQAIQAGSFYACPGAMNCTTCPYRSGCNGV